MPPIRWREPTAWMLPEDFQEAFSPHDDPSPIGVGTVRTVSPYLGKATYELPSP
ncbi:hypothetical protein HMI46_12715 [Paenibacillus alvei]|uniref:Uncharacterized protein n=1 Tax=Paenibacillus alvei TaxID=44250 RepID=A0AAP6ZYZ7_PAEAL|nr:hypothetical protein [Paenibacillus alvei]